MVKCPICSKEMELINNAYFCMENIDNHENSHKVVVLCKCLRRMKPKAIYHNYGKLGFTFWECPHCFNRS